MRNTILSILLVLSAGVANIHVASIYAADGREKDGACVAIQAGELTARIAKNDGRVISLSTLTFDTRHELLSSPGELFLQIADGEPVPLGKFDALSLKQRDGVLTAEGREPGSGVAVVVEWRGGSDLECRVRLVNPKGRGCGKRREATVELRLPCRKQTFDVLAPSGEDHLKTDFSQPLAFAFRGRGRGLVMPAVTLYRPDEDWGVTCFADLNQPTRGYELKIEANPPAIACRRVHLRLEPGRPETVSIILFGHAGDWRPGLGRVVERFSDFFVVADKRLPRLHGGFVCSGGTPSDEAIASWKEQHIQTVEVHGTLPFYGQHLPLGKEWTAFADDRWHTLRQADDPKTKKPDDDAPWKTVHAYVTKKCPPNVSAAKINDYIRRLHTQGMYALMYFNPTEAWKLWIKETYPDDLVRNAAGKTCRAWYESLLVCPNPDSPWGKHLLDEFEKMMDLYPKADGFFMDQSCYDNFDYAHDDGLSISGGRTGYRMGFAINQLSRRCREMAKARGKFMWWNGPYNIDIARYAEGMMAEAGRESQVRRIQYLTIGGRASCTLSSKGESTLQNCAAYGIYPTAMPTPQLRRLAARYWPVFEQFRGKRWVLTAHALKLPHRTKGNIYRLPNGNVLAVMVTSGRSVDGEQFDLDVPVAIRLPDAAEFRAAYFISPDLLGKRRLAVERDGQNLRIVVPRHKSVSAVLLAKTGVHVALDCPFGVVAGGTIEGAVVMDNWTGKPVDGKWTAKQGKNAPVSLAAGQSVRFAFSQKAPSKQQSPRASFNWQAKLPETTPGGRFEFYVDRPLCVNLELPEVLYQDRPATAHVLVFNAGSARDVQATLAAAGIRAEPVRQTARIEAGSKHDFEFRVIPTCPGPIEVKARLVAAGDHAQTGRQCEVCATKASPLAFGRIRSARLLMDVFGSNGGQFANKPVLLGGVKIGVVPQQGDNWGHAEMILPREAVNKLREHNELRIENPPGDNFKVGRFQLRLRMQDGVCLLSELNPGVFSDSLGWLHGEGTGFKNGRITTNIHIAVDPNFKETYEGMMDQARSGELVMELRGVDGGAFAKKPVTLNDVALGDLPTCGDAWFERAVPLPAAALESLGFVNEVIIRNSRPRDAFKVRRIYLRFKLKDGKTTTSPIDSGVYTSVPWQHAEGKIGCPIVVPVRLPR